MMIRGAAITGLPDWAGVSLPLRFPAWKACFAKREVFCTWRIQGGRDDEARTYLAVSLAASATSSGFSRAIRGRDGFDFRGSCNEPEFARTVCRLLDLAHPAMAASSKPMESSRV